MTDKNSPSELKSLNLENDPVPSLSPPGPGTFPVVGWPFHLVRFFKNPLKVMSRLRQNYGDVVRLVNARHPTMIIDLNGSDLRQTRPNGTQAGTFFGFGPKCNRQILNQPEIFESRKARGPKIEAFDRLSNHVLFMNGHRHGEKRRLLMPAFTKEHLEVYHNDMVALTEEMLSGWQSGQRIDLLDELFQLAMKIAARTLFGLDATEHSWKLALRIRNMINSMVSPAAIIPIDLPGSPYRKFRKNIEEIEKGIRFEIERKRSSGVEGNDFLSMMIRARDEEAGRLSDEELVGQAFLMFFVGHDTTASALTWTFYLLAQHPSSSAALADEVAEHLKGGPPTYPQIFSLPVLDQTVKESLRVLCPTVMFPRLATRDTELGGYEIPAGSEVIYSPYMTHHDPECFSDPKKFIPGRWTGLSPSQYEYLPFGAGSHRCIGSSFGAMQLRLITALVSQRFRLQLIPGTRIDAQVVAAMAPKGGLPVILHRQDREFHRSPAEVRGDIVDMVHVDGP